MGMTDGEKFLLYFSLVTGVVGVIAGTLTIINQMETKRQITAALVASGHYPAATTATDYGTWQIAEAYPAPVVDVMQATPRVYTG